MRSQAWTPVLAGLLLVTGAQTIEASPAGDAVEEIRASYKAAKRDKSLTIEQHLAWIDQLFVLSEAGGDGGYEALTAILEISRGARSRQITDAVEFVPGMLIEGWSDDFDKMETLLGRGALGEDLVGDLLARTGSDRVKAACYALRIYSGRGDPHEVVHLRWSQSPRRADVHGRERYRAADPDRRCPRRRLPLAQRLH